MHKAISRIAAALCLATALAWCAVASAQSQDLRIVVIAGEGAVNIIQQKTAVAPIVEVRDRNNVPVAGASVTFSIGGKGATFGSASTLTVTTNAAGQATAAGLTPTAAGAVHVNVTAAFQGQVATAAITQTNFATAQAAAAAGAGGGGGASGGGAAAGAGAGAGGGISATTVGLIGAAVAGGAVAAQQTGLIGGAEGFVVLKGVVFSTIRFGGVCTLPPGSPGHTLLPAECYGPPVAGAVVSTTLDSNTATTDGAGNFDLTTTLPIEKIEECITYTITITAAGHPTYSVNTRGFSGNTRGSDSVTRQPFALSPPTPSFMGGC